MGKILSEKERTAENIEYAVKDIYASMLFAQEIGNTFQGKISGISEWAIFIELENGIEVTELLEERGHTVESMTGTIFDARKKKIATLGEEVAITITSTDTVSAKIF